jgi:hypothetical protein
LPHVRDERKRSIQELIENDLTAYMQSRGFTRAGGHWKHAGISFRHRRLLQWLVPIFDKIEDFGEATLKAHEKLRGEVDAARFGRA